MERKKKIMIISSLSLIAIVIIVSVPKLRRETIENPTIQVDFCNKSIKSIEDIENGTLWVPYKDYGIIPEFESEMAGDEGNLYAPDIIIENGTYMMWYGAQSSSGHDSIHFATSDNGRQWNKYGVVIESGENNHVNDPSVVKVDEIYYMYYTVAPIAELDEIWLATSANGINWTVEGGVLNASQDAEEWDSLKVGRPSVIYKDGMFKMWFDGSQRDLVDSTIVRQGSGRHVGYATSMDGYTWTKYEDNPIIHHSGAVDVKYLDNKYILVEESRNGVYYRIGNSEIDFPETNNILFSYTNTSFDKYGHVTPFILVKNNQWVATYTGAATKTSWDRNRISVWYPMYNISIEQTINKNSEKMEIETNIQPWALSNGLIQWTLELDSYNTTINLRLYFANLELSDIEIEIRSQTQFVKYENMNLLLIS